MQAETTETHGSATGDHAFPLAAKRREFSQLAKLALKDGSIWPAFQPIVNLKTRDTVGFEILARWSDIASGNIPPDRFIRRFEEYNLIDPLTERLLNVASRQLRQLDTDAFMAVNIAPKQLLRHDLPDRIVSICERAGISPRRVEIEVTENSLIQDPARSLETLRAIDRLGMKISIDDFGTGYSSLSRLESFPFHKLKIDAQFVRNIDADTSKRRIVAAIIGLGQSLGISIVAEGIETPEQARIVGELGCTYGQGWLFGRPVDAASLTARDLRSSKAHDQSPVDRSPFQQFHQLQTLYEQAPVGLCFVDLRYRYVQVNDLFSGMHGKRPAEILGKTIAEVLDFTLYRRVKAILDAAQMKNLRLDNRFEIDGRVYRILGNQVQDISGETIGFSLVSLDVTEQEQMIRELEERDQHYRHLMELGPNIGWAADPSGKVDYMSPLRDSVPGEAMEERITRWYSRLHPDDAPRVREIWLDHLESGLPFEVGFRILWEEGSYHQVSSRAVPCFDGEGKISRWYGVISGT